MALKYKLAVPNGTYQKDGQTKTAWLNIGAIMSKQNGGFVMKLDAIPTNVIDKDGNSVPFNGWVNMFEHGDGNGQQQNAPQPAAPASNNFDDDVPFAPVNGKIY